MKRYLCYIVLQILCICLLPIKGQSPLRTVDPSGNVIKYNYDYQGRLIKITAPEELKKGEDYTIRYTYNLVGHNLKTLPTYLQTHIYKELYDPDFVQNEVTL